MNETSAARDTVLRYEVQFRDTHDPRYGPGVRADVVGVKAMGVQSIYFGVMTELMFFYHRPPDDIAELKQKMSDLVRLANVGLESERTKSAEVPSSWRDQPPMI